MSGFRQLAAALSSTGSAQQYAHDMDRMRSVLNTAPQHFPWSTALLLVLIVAVWFGMLTAVWVYLNRRRRRSSEADDYVPAMSRAQTTV